MIPAGKRPKIILQRSKRAHPASHLDKHNPNHRREMQPDKSRPAQQQQATTKHKGDKSQVREQYDISKELIQTECLMSLIHASHAGLALHAGRHCAIKTVLLNIRRASFGVISLYSVKKTLHFLHHLGFVIVIEVIALRHLHLPGVWFTFERNGALAGHFQHWRQIILTV